MVLVVAFGASESLESLAARGGGAAKEKPHRNPIAATSAKSSHSGNSASADKPSTPVEDWLDRQMSALDKTRAIVADKQEIRRQQKRRRVRAAYKLFRAGSAPLWLDSRRRGEEVVQRSALRRALRRDIAEIGLLDEEMTAVDSARQQIAADRRRADEISPPAPRSLRIPVAWSRVVEPFGLYRDPATRASLTRRGVWLSSRPGRNIRAMAGGEVIYAGNVRGLGLAVIVDHGHFTSICGPLAEIRAARGHAIEAGDIAGESAGDRVYVEIRLDVGPGGFPIDPQPLIDWTARNL